MKNYEEFINKRFDKSQEIDETFVDFLSKEDYAGALDYLKNVGATELDMDSYGLLLTVSEYTYEQGAYKDFESLKNHLLKNEDFIKSVNEEYNEKLKVTELIIDTTIGPVCVIPLSKLIPEAKNRIEHLEDEKRFGNCYENNKIISLNIGKQNDLVIGYIYGYTDISEFLHIWVEVTIKGKEYVIDSIFNAVINKDAYYRLLRAKPLNKVSSEVIKEDIEKYLEQIGVFPIEPYLMYHDEIISDFEKNKEIFKK